MKIIFLDLDGPIINNRYSVAHGDSLIGSFQLLDTVSCRLVKKMCEETGAQIVLTSARRNKHSYEAWVAIFNAACGGLGDYLVHHPEMFRTERTSQFRADEIELWLMWAQSALDEEVTAYVIIDDDSLQPTGETQVKYLEERLVRTATYDGISYGNYLNAIEILENRKPNVKF